MYARYTRKRVGVAATEYELQEQVSLFGSNNGFIPRLLDFNLPKGQGEPYKWHVDVVAELDRQDDYRSNTLLIDLKPKQNKTNLSLYEVRHVWGYSEDGWSPILLCLDGLFVDEDPNLVNRNKFVREDRQIDGPIYEFLYLDGSVKDGNRVGRWSPPPMSPTNAALLWPETLKFFIQCINENNAKRA
jgi:hypothetical protein